VVIFLSWKLYMLVEKKTPVEALRFHGGDFSRLG